MDNMTFHLNDVPANNIPDLDWLKLNIEDKENIPVPFNVQIIPQLEEQWSHKTDKGVALTPNNTSYVVAPKGEFSPEDILGVVRSAKVAAMQGVTGKALAEDLGRKYQTSLIAAAKGELVKVAEEQGLLGNVYIDLSAFNSCKEASNKLGSNKIRSAQFVTGSCRHVCSSHNDGYCSELKKSVVDKVAYDSVLLSSYEKHLKVTGKIAADEKIDSKGALQEALLKSDAPKASNKAGDAEFSNPNNAMESFKDSKEAFEKELVRKEASIKSEQLENRFESAKPILASIQNSMLKGRMGKSLKEDIANNFSVETISKYSSEISKMVSLQGLLGTVYADVSYYRDAGEAIKAIKQASTSPQYLVQTVVSNNFDNTLEVVARATGCAILPKDGKIDSKIAHSYIDDIMFSDRIALDVGTGFKSAIEAGENVLSVIREAFMATLGHKKSVKTAGVQATFTSKGERKETVNKEHLKTASFKAIQSGVSLEDLEHKLASYLPAVEAAGLVEGALSSVREISASVLNNCTTQKYALKNDTLLKPVAKCAGCIFNNKTSCIKVKLAFKGTEEVLINPVGEASENRGDINSEYQISDDSGMNITIRKFASDKNSEVSSSYSNEGIDSVMGDL